MPTTRIRDSPNTHVGNTGADGWSGKECVCVCRRRAKKVSTFKKLTMPCTFHSHLGNLWANLFIQGVNDHGHKEKCSSYQDLTFSNVLDGGTSFFCSFLTKNITP